MCSLLVYLILPDSLFSSAALAGRKDGIAKRGPKNIKIRADQEKK